MQKIKDIIYDKNDLFIALIIIIIASAIMFNRIDAIMTYPSASMVKTTVNKGSENPPKPAATTKGEDENITDEPFTETSTTPGNTSSGALSTDPPVQNTTSSGVQGVVNYSIYIEPGSSAAAIADLVLSVKLVQSRDEFLQAVNNSGLSGKLKSGTFIIPSDASLEKVIQILTR